MALPARAEHYHGGDWHEDNGHGADWHDGHARGGDWHGDGWHGDGWRGGDIRYFHERDLPRWRSGRWHHGYHDGRVGWWWIVGSLWYFYPQRVAGYPDPYTPPPVVVVQERAPAPSTAPPPSQYWYYCDSAKGYYPYVPTCPGGWRMVLASPPDIPAQ